MGRGEGLARVQQWTSAWISPLSAGLCRRLPFVKVGARTCAQAHESVRHRTSPLIDLVDLVTKLVAKLLTKSRQELSCGFTEHLESGSGENTFQLTVKDSTEKEIKI